MADLIASAAELPGALRVPGLELELRTDSQWETAYLNDRPILTARRCPVMDKVSAPWQLYATDGRLVAKAWSAAGCVRRAASYAKRLP